METAFEYAPSAFTTITSSLGSRGPKSWRLFARRSGSCRRLLRLFCRTRGRMSPSTRVSLSRASRRGFGKFDAILTSYPSAYPEAILTAVSLEEAWVQLNGRSCTHADFYNARFLTFSRSLAGTACRFRRRTVRTIAAAAIKSIMADIFLFITILLKLTVLLKSGRRYLPAVFNNKTIADSSPHSEDVTVKGCRPGDQLETLILFPLRRKALQAPSAGKIVPSGAIISVSHLYLFFNVNTSRITCQYK